MWFHLSAIHISELSAGLWQILHNCLAASVAATLCRVRRQLQRVTIEASHASVGLWQGNHDGLAAFMAATGRAALPEAAALSGLSLQKEFELCKGKHRL